MSKQKHLGFYKLNVLTVWETTAAIQARIRALARAFEQEMEKRGWIVKNSKATGLAHY